MMIKRLYIILEIGCICSFSYAQTYIGGGTITGATWTLSRSPYIVQGNLAIDTLVIEPGVVVQFDGNYKFDVNDELHAEGFYSDSIYFRPSPGNSNGWQGIKFKIDASASSISYCRIEGSSLYGIKTEGSNPSIRNCRIVNNKGGGLWIKDNSVNLNHCYIAHNDVNGIFPDRGRIIASNLIIAKNNGYGIFSTDTNDSLFLKNVTIIADSPNVGIYCETEKVFIKNSIIYGNINSIISSDILQNVTYSDIQLNNLYPGIGNINEDPLFQDSLNYLLPNGSPCIDKGDFLEIYNDKYFPPSKGGDRNDMGAYGGPEANLWYPPIYVKPQSMDFGRVRRDSTNNKDLKILNYRDSTLHVSTISFVLDTSNVFGANKSDFSLDEADSTDLTTSFTPDSVHNYFADLEFVIDSLGTVSIPLHGQGVIPEIYLYKTELDFNEVSLGDTSTLDLPIYNWGSDTLHLVLLAPEDFAFSLSQSNLLYVSINPGSTGDTVKVTFFPHSPITYQDSLIILSDDPANPQLKVILSGIGTGPSISFFQEILNFGSVPLSIDSVLTFRIENVGNQQLTISEVSVPDSMRTIFIFDDTTFTIQAGDSANLPVKFEPADSGWISCNLSIISDDPFQEDTTILLTGRGIVPQIQVSSAEINFGKVSVDTSSEHQLTIYNKGEAILVIDPDSLYFTGLDSSYFSIENELPNTLIKPNDSLEILILFHPREIKSYQSELHILSNDPYHREFSVNLSGLGVVAGLDISSTNLDFGKIPRLSDSSQVLTIFNTGEAPLIIFKDSLTLTGQDSNQFGLDEIGQNITLVPGDSENISIHFNPDLVGPKQAFLNICSNDPGNPKKMVSLTGLAYDEAAADIAFSQTHSSNPFMNRKNATAAFTISSHSPVDSAFLYLRRGGKSQFIKYSLVNSYNNVWSIAIDSVQVTKRGLDYYVTAYHGWRTSLYPLTGSNKPNCIQVYIPNLDFPGQTKQEIYQMISIPVFSFGQDLEELFADNLGAYNKTKYRIFDCMNGIDYTEITELNQTLSPGKSIWLITKEPRKLDVSNVESVISNQDYLLPLHQGWNMIATPYAFSIDWTQISPDLPSRYYDGTEWLFVSVMEPFKGYAVYVTNDTIISIPPQQAQSSKVFQKPQYQLSGHDWQIQIGVVSGQLKDRFNYAGVRSNATSDIDHFDYAEPPPIGSYVSLYLLPENQSNFYSTDYRQPGMDGYIFRIGFSSNVSGEKTIKFSPENLPVNFDWLVASEDTKIKYIHKDIQIEAKQASFRLFVGSTDFIEQASTAYLNMPTSFKLNQNYPNPFNPTTLVKFQLPGRETVTMNIYDILGQHIRTLLEKDKMEPGYYQVQWNGLNDSGNQVATGIYFLQFRTQKVIRTIKMILQK